MNTFLSGKLTTYISIVQKFVFKVVPILNLLYDVVCITLSCRTLGHHKIRRV